MKKNISIQVKAVFLLFVFALNTIMGFACSIGMDMGFNTGHHQPGSNAKVHIHADGKKHVHQSKSTHQHQAGNKGKKEKGGCCNDVVIKFSQTDKSVPQTGAALHPVFFTTFAASWYAFDIFYPSQTTGCVRYFVRGHHPPIPDICIAVQRFQI